MSSNVKHGRTRANTAWKCDSGSALLIAVLLVAILGIGTAALYRHLNRSFDDYARFERDLKITHLADAGIDAAIAALRRDDAPETLELALGEGVVCVSIGGAAAPATHRIVSRAQLNHDGVVRASGTYVAEVRLMPDGAVQRLSWQREKKQ